MIQNSDGTKIVEGRTTKNEIRAMFGSPLKANFTDGGLDIWNYGFSNVSADAISHVLIVNLFGGSASGTKKELVALFESNKTVKRYLMREPHVTQKIGLFNN